jgi:MinD-like ATPase involved in chromosome partitioning or flagellar assembly/DNA-binding NarL/FixJ family response regulator
LDNYRVLLIDPDPTTTKYLAYELKKTGLSVYATNNFKEGLVLAYQQRPHVIILEPDLTLLESTGFLEKLHKDRRTSRTRVIAFSGLTDPEEIQTVIDMDFYHYMAKEGASVPLLIEHVQTAAKEAREAADRKTFKKTTDKLETPKEDASGQKVVTGGTGKLVVFLSAKGGIGTSSICANLAHQFNPVNEAKVAVVDLVLPIGSIASIVGYNGELNIVEAAAQKQAETGLEFLENALPQPDNWNFKLLAGSPSPEASNRLEVKNIPVIINNLRKVYEFVFVDLGRSLSRISMPIITSASQIVLMLSLEQTTVSHTKSVFEYLYAQGVPKNMVYLLINRAVGMDGLAKGDVEQELGTRIPLALPHMGRDFSLANNLNQPVSMKFPQDAVTFSLVQAAEEINERIS